MASPRGWRTRHPCGHCTGDRGILQRDPGNLFWGVGVGAGIGKAAGAAVNGEEPNRPLLTPSQRAAARKAPAQNRPPNGKRWRIGQRCAKSRPPLAAARGGRQIAAYACDPCPGGTPPSSRSDPHPRIWPWRAGENNDESPRCLSVRTAALPCFGAGAGDGRPLHRRQPRRDAGRRRHSAPTVGGSPLFLLEINPATARSSRRSPSRQSHPARRHAHPGPRHLHLLGPPDPLGGRPVT